MRKTFGVVAVTSLALAVVACVGVGRAQQGAASNAGEQLDDADRVIKRGLQNAGETVPDGFAKTREAVMGVESRVYGRLHWDKALNASSLDLVVRGGIVTLRGAPAATDGAGNNPRDAAETLKGGCHGMFHRPALGRGSRRLRGTPPVTIARTSGTIRTGRMSPYSHFASRNRVPRAIVIGGIQTHTILPPDVEGINTASGMRVDDSIRSNPVRAMRRRSWLRKARSEMPTSEMVGHLVVCHWAPMVDHAPQ
jgi:hypothetical protein